MKMAPAAKKRALEADKPTLGSAKRLKAAGGRSRNRGAQGTKGKRPEKLRAAVSLDALDWKEAVLPDRLDDAEGFLGLEEVDDVEVIRNDESGKIEYRYKGTDKEKAPAESVDDETGLSQPLSTSVPEEEAEWEGFSDVEGAGEDADGELATVRKSSGEAQARSQGRQKTEKLSKPKRNVEKPPKKRRKQKNQSEESGGDAVLADPNPFSKLDNEVNDDGVDVSAWRSLDLSEECLLALAKLGFERPTPIQKAAIPHILAQHDVIGKAVTGSGKTLAFGIPILESFLASSSRRERRLRKESNNNNNKGGDEPGSRPPLWALIISPTRELAHQLSRHLEALFSNVPSAGPFVCTLTGGLSLQKQRRLLSRANVVVATPGRLWEVIDEGIGLMEWLKKTRYLVVDEADRLFSDGHFKELDQILDLLDRDDVEEGDPVQDAANDGVASSPRRNRQTLVFSATFHRDLQERLAGAGGRRRSMYSYRNGDAHPTDYLLEKLRFREERPKFIDVNPTYQMVEGLKERIVECAALEKDLFLYALLLYNTGKRTLIFTNSVSAVRRLTPFLQTLNIGAQALHSHMIQKARLRAVERFAGGGGGGGGGAAAASDAQRYSVLVATDVAARGLDIPNVELVVHYHVPRTADMYVHRSGRTARAGHSGASVLLCAPDEVAGVGRLVAKVHASASRASAKKKDGKDGKEGKDGKDGKDGKGGSSDGIIRSLDLDRRVIARLRPRVALAKRIVDATLAKEKKNSEDVWLRKAAGELGVAYDSDDFGAAAAGAGRVRGKGREQRERELRALTKSEVAALRAELRALLQQRINVGVSERYIAGVGGGGGGGGGGSGGLGVDVNKLLAEMEGKRPRSLFLGGAHDEELDL